MKSSQPLGSLTKFITIALVCCTGLSASAERPPNIVFFLTDDQGVSTIGCYGNEVVRTPNIDRLADQGTRFENAFVSQPICWVSRTTILTGLTGRSYGTPSNPDVARPDAVETLYTDILRENGYRTAHIGKWHAKMPKGWKAQDHFDEYDAIGRDPFYKTLPDGSLRHETDLIVDRGIDFIKRQGKDKPFSLNLWFNACHAEDSDRRPGIGQFPWPESTNGMYEDITIAPPRLGDPEIFEKLPEFLQTSITRERYFWRWNTPEKYQTNIRAYYRMVTGIDNAIGRFLSALDEADLTDNTIIVYSADNGYLMGNRGLAGKWSHYEESTHVPLIIRDPRVSTDHQGQVTDAIALNLDLPSTFLDWAGIKPPERYQGTSLKPIVDGKKPEDWRTETFHEHFAVRDRIPAFEGIRNERFKYDRYIDHDQEFLHDLEKDPDELINLANDPEYAAILKSMRERTNAEVDRLGGPLDPLKGGFKASTAAHPESTASVSFKAGKDGFVRLFNGKNLNGWTGEPKYWSVRNGAITGVTDGKLKRNHFISWEGSTIRNFDLRMKVKISNGGNSGIQYRSTPRPEIGLDVVSGYQCDVVSNNSNYNGMVYEERQRRILSHAGEKVIVDPKGQPWVVGKFTTKDPAPDKWHDFRILAQGNRIQHWIDGHPTAELIDLDEKGRSLDGVLAMQVHVGPAMEVQFKDIRIKHLPDNLPLITPDKAPIPATAYGVRPQAKLPKDWKPPVYGEQ
ncbi:sulfatase-like hydrolase/transferase [Haloferula chungangensis]|uniref:Sulfatase-like hydrolase/transferase n=1 Tax=Haloferula chungangensis TaxID=1048331 RepID=A0ABW2L3D2_9BACT